MVGGCRHYKLLSRPKFHVGRDPVKCVGPATITVNTFTGELLHGTRWNTIS